MALAKALLASFFALLALALQAPSANAGWNYFCPAGSGSVSLGPNGFCVSGHYNYLSRVQFTTTNGDGVSHCAVAKWNADGSGSNAIPASCGTVATVFTTCIGPSSISAYAKGTSQSPTTHLFWSYAAYSGSC
jgi:hypothetical protein